MLFVGRASTTFVIVTLTFVLFRAGSLEDAIWIYQAVSSGAEGKRTIALTAPCIAIILVVGYDLFLMWGKDFTLLPVWLRWVGYYAAVACVLKATIVHFHQASPDVQQFIYFKF